jgi:serine/threonine-protein kinase
VTGPAAALAPWFDPGRTRTMTDDPRVQQLLDQLLDGHATPEVVCATCPELLPVVRNRWQQMRLLRADLDALFPSPDVPSTKRDALSPPPEPIPRPPAGTVLPRIPGYEVEAVLGRGGMGVVFKARHLKLKRVVALKMLLAGAYAGPEELARFRREAEAVAALHHPNIVQVHDAGEIAGRPYFTMECVEGGTLSRSLADKPQPPRRAAELVATLASAVRFAHQSGFIHRDLKPANVLLTSDGVPKITDFGLVRSIASGPEVTRTGDFLGTPCYMAPEQAAGRASAVGPAADIYALGAVLFEMLTGRPPFDGETAAETVQKVIAEEPAPPSRWNAKVPRDLDTICLKCLQKSPARRYASAQDLADDLHRFLDGKPVLARPVGIFERAGKWARRRPAAALLALVLLVVSAAAAGTVFWLRQQEADRRAANEQRQGQAREALETALRRADDLRGEGRWKEALVVLADASPQLAEADSPSLEERLRQAQADFQNADALATARENYLLLPDGTIDYNQRANDFLKAFESVGFRIDDDPERVADSIRTSAIRDQFVAALEERAVVASMVNDEPLVERLLSIAALADPGSPWRDRFRVAANWRRKEQLLELAATAFTSSPPPTEHQLALLALLLRARGAWGQSARVLAEACQRQPRNFWAHREMGLVLALQDQNLEAAGYYRVALALRPDNATAHAGLALCLSRLYQSDGAIAAFRRAVKSTPNSASTRARLVETLANAGYWNEAEAECRRALEVDPTNYLAPLHLAGALSRHGRVEEALIQCRKVTEAGPNVAEAHVTRAGICAHWGQHEEAVTAYRRVMELKAAHFRVDHFLAQELAAVGRWEEALTVLQTAVALYPTYPWLHLEMGRIYRSHGKPEAAIEAFRSAATHSPGFAPPLDGLIEALLHLGRFAEARTAIESRLKIRSTDAERRAQRRQLDLCNSMLAIQSKLSAILAGQERPTDVPTQGALAEWCLKYKRLPATAVGFYASALATQPSLADDLEADYRAHAAGAAALAGCGVGEDAAQLDDRRHADLRKLALDWLTAEYNACAERHRLGKPGDRTIVATVVRSWQRDEDLAVVRDEPALGKLPPDEQRAWQALWEKVAALAARDPTVQFEQARAHVARREWKQAAQCYADGMELEPTEDGELWFEYAAAQVLSGDRSGYRQTCTHMLARCQPAGPMRPYLVARACTLAPESIDQPARASRLSQNELLERNQTEFWALTELGALRLRTLRQTDSVVFLEKSLAADGRPGRAVLNWLWLALVYHKLGSPSEARRWLDKAANWLDQQGCRMPAEDRIMGSHLHNWLEAHVLQQEAEAWLR